MCYGTAAGLRKRPAGSGSICAAAEVVEPMSVVHDLGFWIDVSDQIIRTTVTTRVCYSHLRRLTSLSSSFVLV